VCFDANSYNRLAGRGVDLNEMAQKTLGSQRMRIAQEEKMGLEERFVDELTKKGYNSFCQTFSVRKGEWVRISDGERSWLDEVCAIVESITSSPPLPENSSRAAKERKKPKSKPKPKPEFMQSLTGESDKLMKTRSASRNAIILFNMFTARVTILA